MISTLIVEGFSLHMMVGCGRLLYLSSICQFYLKLADLDENISTFQQCLGQS